MKTYNIYQHCLILCIIISSSLLTACGNHNDHDHDNHSDHGEHSEHEDSLWGESCLHAENGPFISVDVSTIEMEAATADLSMQHHAFQIEWSSDQDSYLSYRATKEGQYIIFTNQMLNIQVLNAQQEEVNVTALNEVSECTTYLKYAYSANLEIGTYTMKVNQSDLTEGLIVIEYATDLEHGEDHDHEDHEDHEDS
jgi:hypothetical protein